MSQSEDINVTIVSADMYLTNPNAEDRSIEAEEPQVLQRVFQSGFIGNFTLHLFSFGVPSSIYLY